MVRARYEPSTTAGLTVPVNRAVEYTYDESTGRSSQPARLTSAATDDVHAVRGIGGHAGTVISTSPMLPDPYEQQRVLVAPSSIPGAGEGLFARRPLVKGVRPRVPPPTALCAPPAPASPRALEIPRPLCYASLRTRAHLRSLTLFSHAVTLI